MISINPQNQNRLAGIGTALQQLGSGHAVDLSGYLQRQDQLRQQQGAAAQLSQMDAQGMLARFSPEQRQVLMNLPPEAAQRVIAEVMFAPEPEKPATYTTVTGDQAAAMGLPSGGAYKVNNLTGEVSQITAPPRPGVTNNISTGNAGPQVGTIPQGYELFQNPETGAWAMRAIPGGPEDASAKEAAAAGNRATSTDVIVSAASRARAAADDRALTGMAGQLASNLPGTANAEVYRQVDVLKSNATVENLTAMRQASPTGGALGSVTEKEGAMLAAKAGALDPASPTFQRDLDDYERTLLRIVHGPEEGDRIFAATRAQDPPAGDTGGASHPDFATMSDAEIQAWIEANEQ